MSFDLRNHYLDPETGTVHLGWYETEGIRKITELSRQVRSLLNFKTHIIQCRFHSNSSILPKPNDIKFYENKKKFEALALRFIKLLNRIKGISIKTLEEEIQFLFYQVRSKKDQVSLSLLRELKDLIFPISMKIHYFSEQALYNQPNFLKTLIIIAKEICITRKNIDHAFSEFYDELGMNYRNLEDDLTSIVPDNVFFKEKRKIKQLSEGLRS